MICRFASILIALLFPLAAYAQTAETPMASVKGKVYTSAAMSTEGQKAFAGQKAEIEATRTQLLSQMIAEELLRLEAKAASSTPEKLIAAQRAKAAEPTATQIQAVYDANLAALGNKTLEEVRTNVVAFLRRDPEKKAIDAYIASLQAKYKYVAGKNVNALNLAPLDLLATIGTRQIAVQEFDAKNKFALNEVLHHQYEHLRSDLEISILNGLIEEEAKAKNTDASSIIAAEITDKMREFSDGEREGLETALMNRLFAKYEVKLLIKEPEIIAQNVSADDDPSQGAATAPVTVVMFSDFQCPACARTHPVLKKVIAEFGDKVRFVLRDYPLENIHANAFVAALAANAAHKQGKYFEYAETLYRNQETLDKASLIKFAGEIGLNVKQFEIDLTDAKAAAEVKKDRADGEAYGVGSTPTIFVNGVKVHSLSASAFRRAINRALAK